MYYCPSYNFFEYYIYIFFFYFTAKTTGRQLIKKIQKDMYITVSVSASQINTWTLKTLQSVKDKPLTQHFILEWSRMPSSNKTAHLRK